MGLMSGHCTLNTISGRHPAGQPDQVPKMPDAVFGICSISALFQMKEHCVSCDCLSDLKMYNPSPPHYCSHRTELTFNLMCTCEHTWQPRQDWQKYYICLSHCVLLLRLRKQFPSLPIKKLSEHTVYTRLWTLHLLVPYKCRHSTQAGLVHPAQLTVHLMSGSLCLTPVLFLVSY